MKNIYLKKLLLVIGDIALLYLALFLTVKIRYGSLLTPELWVRHLIPFSLLFVIWIVVFFINNLYTIEQASNDFKFYSYLIQNVVINTFIGFTFFYLAPASFTTLSPLRVLVLLVFIYVALFLLWRNLFYMLTSNKKFTNRILFLGVNDDARALMKFIKQNPQLGYTTAVVIDPEKQFESDDSVVVLHNLSNLKQTVRENTIQTIVTSSVSGGDADITRYLFETLDLKLQYHSLTDFYEHLTGKIPIRMLEKNWFIENLFQGNKRFYDFGKRLQDVVFSIVFGLLSLLIIPFIILGIKLTSPGPILFKQVRTGKGGKHFTAMKFRSMVDNAEKDGAQWAQKHDPRVTKFGRILRKTRLDEIPQFINIFLGDMSFVGPRPERPEFVSMLSEKIPFYKERLLVKPGLSGWAQINYKYGDTVEDAMTKLQYDIFYIKNRSFALDISIVLKTINTVLNAGLGQ